MEIFLTLSLMTGSLTTGPAQILNYMGAKDGKLDRRESIKFVSENRRNSTARPQGLLSS